MQRRIAPVSLLMFLLILLLGSPILAQSDNFDDGNDDGWTRYDPLASVGAPAATFSFPNGGYRIEVPSSPDPASFGQARAGSYRTDTTYTDFFVSVDLVEWDNTLGQAIGSIARISDVGLGTTDGYAFFYFPESGNVQINLLENEVASSPDQTGDSEANLDPAKDYRMTFRGVGDNLVGQIFDLADLSTPLVNVTAIDSTYASGHAGIVAAAEIAFPTSTADATFDNYAASVPEPSSVALALVAMAVLSAGCRMRTLKTQ